MARPTLRTPFRLSLLLIVAAAVVLRGDRALAQFTLTSLVTTTKDSHLKNAWGLAYLPSGPFWISDEDTGVSTLYDANGTIVSLVVTVPPATTGTGTPTGIVGTPLPASSSSTTPTPGPLHSSLTLSMARSVVGIPAWMPLLP